MPVAIIVKEGTPRSPAWRPGIRKPRFCGDIGKCPVAVILVESILPVISNEDIFESIVVVVCDGNSARPAGASQASIFRNIGEGPIPVVPIETVGRGRHRIDSASTQQEDVQP